MSDANSLNQSADRQQQGQPEGIQSWLRGPLTVVALGMSIDEPVDKPAGICLPNHASEQQRYAEDQTRLDDIELVELAEHDGARAREENTSVAETHHVVERRY